jgi:hypothetical protein
LLYWSVIKLYPRTLEITGLVTYFHQHVRWIMSHQMAVNLSLIYNRVFCAQTPTGQWNYRNDLFSDPYVQRRWSLLYHNQIRERDQRVRCWNSSYLVRWGISWREIQLIEVSDVEVALCEFWSIRTLYKALILNSSLHYSNVSVFWFRWGCHSHWIKCEIFWKSTTDWQLIA